MTKEEIIRLVNLTEKEMTDLARQHAKATLEGHDGETTGQKIEDHEDAAGAIMEDFIMGYQACLNRISNQIGLPVSDSAPPT